MSHSLVQNYTYDSLNRLESAIETSNSAQTWRQEFSYDRYGNRNFVTGTGHTTTLGSGTTMCNPTFDASNNRITSAGFSFDLSGNTTRDAGDRKFTYDAENKQSKVETLSAGTNTVTGTIGEYSYDGDGKRVKKYVPSTGETTIFVYDAAGKLIGEYSTIVANSTDAKVNFLTTDNLGSPRVNTDALGAVIARHDYHPFGEEIDATYSRSTAGYNSDTVRKQFTGYQRDDETALDFANARIFANLVGRFMSADSTMLGVNGKIPQSWNQYSYVMNNPYFYTDPLGLWGMAVTYVYETDENNEYVTDKKGNRKVKYAYVFFYKTKDEDNGDSLAKQLGMTGDKAKEFAKEVDDFNSTTFYPEDSKNDNVSFVFEYIGDRLRGQKNRDLKGEDSRDDSNCAGTANQIAERSRSGPALIQPTQFDLDLKRFQKVEDESKIKLGDVFRYATGNGKNGQHFTSFIFRNDDGTSIVFSKSGWKGRFEIGNAKDFETPMYGSISGLYRRQ